MPTMILTMVPTTSEDQITILLKAAQANNVETLSAQREFLSFSSNDDWTLLFHHAAGAGAWEACEFLLQQQGTPKLQQQLLYAKAAKQGRTALHWAARNGHAHICRKLVLSYGLPVDVEATGQVTPLQLAVWQAHLETCRVLVQDCGADPHYINAWGCTVAHWLAKCPYGGSIRTSDDDDDHHHHDAEQDNPQPFRQQQQNVENCCLWLFEECHVPYDTANTHGQTPLHKAAFAGNPGVLRYLVKECGMLDDTVDHQGNNAADCATRNVQHTAAVWLRRYASPLRNQAWQSLGWRHGTEMPDLPTVRRLYRHQAQLYHPDGRRKEYHGDKISRDNTSYSQTSWQIIARAYRLLVDWWTAPDVYDATILLETRQARLQEVLAILWHTDWHKQHESPNPCTAHTDMLHQFEHRLVGLLRTPAHRTHGLALAQLPKEYGKNYRRPDGSSHVIPDPKIYRCKNLKQLLVQKCPRVHVEGVNVYAADRELFSKIT